MIGVSEFREIVSGQRTGIGATFWRTAFRLCEIPYSITVKQRNRRYDCGKAEIHRVDVPVISVGNLTTGGTGKTPMVEWLARWFRRHDVRVTLISRGYGAQRGAMNDEALELEQMLPEVPHLQDPDRVAMAQVALEELDCQLILLDDGFQHRRLHRDLDIVLLDAIEPFGYDHLLPRGLLREPLSGLKRAHVIALTRADMVSKERRSEIRKRAQRYAKDAAWIEVAHQPRELLSAEGQRSETESLKGQRVAAFCGIGNPEGFRRTLESSGYQLAGLREFPDHHRYSRDDIQSIASWIAELGETAAVVCTHKDLVKVGVEKLGGRPLRALVVRLEILAGQVELEAKLRPMLPLLS